MSYISISRPRQGAPLPRQTLRLPLPAAPRFMAGMGRLGRLGEEEEVGVVGVARQLSAQHQAALQAAMHEAVGDFDKEFKKTMMKIAAAQTGVTVALAVIPVVGWALSLVAGVVQAFAGSRYRNEAKAILDKAGKDVQNMQAASEARIDAKLMQVISANESAAMNLAMDMIKGTAPMNGLGSLRRCPRALPLHEFQGLGLGKKLRRAAKKATGKVTSVVKKVHDEVVVRPTEQLIDLHKQAYKDAGRGIDYLSGRVAKQEARKKANEIKEKARISLEENEAKIMAELASPEFSANLRRVMATEIVNSDVVRAALSGASASPFSVSTASQASVDMPAVPKQNMAPLAIGAAAVAAALLLS